MTTGLASLDLNEKNKAAEEFGVKYSVAFKRDSANTFLRQS